MEKCIHHGVGKAGRKSQVPTYNIGLPRELLHHTSIPALAQHKINSSANNIISAFKYTRHRIGEARIYHCSSSVSAIEFLIPLLAQFCRRILFRQDYSSLTLRTPFSAQVGPIILPKRLFTWLRQGQYAGACFLDIDDLMSLLPDASPDAIAVVALVYKLTSPTSSKSATVLLAARSRWFSSMIRNRSSVIPNSSSIFSRLMPLVSGIRKNAKKKVSTQKVPKRIQVPWRRR